MIVITPDVNPKSKLNLAQFLAQCPDRGRYELIAGEMVEMVNTRQHKIISMFIMFLFHDEIKRLQLSYDISNEAVLATVNKNGNEQGRVPDVSVIDYATWHGNLADYGALTEPIQLAVEVVSTNWEDDYIYKLDEYQRLGIPEYWIVDYLALGSRTYLGSPKQPSVLIFTLTSTGEYELTRFQHGDRLISPTFPELNVTVDQIVAA